MFSKSFGSVHQSGPFSRWHPDLVSKDPNDLASFGESVSYHLHLQGRDNKATTLPLFRYRDLKRLLIAANERKTGVDTEVFPSPDDAMLEPDSIARSRDSGSPVRKDVFWRCY